ACGNARERCARGAARGKRRRGFLVYWCEWSARAGFRREAAQLASRAEVSRNSVDPRRSAGRMAGPVARALELSDVRGDGRGAGDHQSARLVRLWTEVRGRSVEGLGR